MKPKLTAEEYQVIDSGYRRVYQPATTVRTVAKKDARLSGLKRGQRVKPRRVLVQHHSPPKSISEAALLQMLREHGIGRPATYAEIIDSLMQRDYVKRDGGNLSPTPRGREVCTFLIREYPTLFEAGFTAQMERGLDAIAAGRASYKDTIQTVWEQIKK